MKNILLKLLTLHAALVLTVFGAAAAETNSTPTDTNSSAAHPTKDTKVDFSLDLGSSPLPHEILDKLSADQIVELEKAKNSHTDLESIIVPIAFFGCIIGIVAVVVTFRFKRNKMLHETVRTMIEKGTPIPPELLKPHDKPRRPRSDLRNGLLFIAIGVALILWSFTGGHIPLVAGLIPLLMGVAFLVTWKIENNKND